MSLESWLERESANWQADGLISEETRAAILARHPTQSTDPSRALIPLAVLTAGVGVMLIVAWNWWRLSDAVKLGATGVLAVSLYAGAWRAGGRGSRWCEAWWLAAPLGAWAALGTWAEVRGWHDDQTLAFWCAAVAAVSAAGTGRVLAAVLGAGAPIWWLMLDGGGHMQWAFPLVFAVAAIGVERARHRAPAITAAIAFGFWAAMLNGTTFRVSLAMPLAALAAGAALVQWSRRPDGRRPAFARVTPGRAVMVVGLALGLLMTLHPPAGDTVAGALWRVRDGHRAWEALALMGGLVVIGAGVWPRPDRIAVEARIASVFVAVWFAVAAANQLMHISPWVWVTLASALLLGCGAAWVREAASTQDRGTFALGIVAVIVLSAAHFTSTRAAGAWRGAVVLLVSAAVLAAAARATAAKTPDAKSPR